MVARILWGMRVLSQSFRAIRLSVNRETGVYMSRWSKALQWIVMGCAMAAIPALAQEQPPRLFTQVQTQEPPAEPGPWSQTWHIEIDQQAIQQPAEAITLNLPGQREIVVRREFWSPRQGYMILLVGDGPETIELPDPNVAPEDFSWRWYGRTDGYVVALTFEKGYLAGRIWGPGGKYALSPREGKRTELGLVNPDWWQLHPERDEPPQMAVNDSQSELPMETAMNEHPAGPGSWDLSCPGPLPTAVSKIDVLVLYTSAVFIANGSTLGGVRVVAQREIDEANQSLRNSLVNSVRFYLSGIQAVPETESPFYDAANILVGLNRLAGTIETPGVYPGWTYPGNPAVRGLRDTYGADIVALARKDLSGLSSCGVAFVQRYYNYSPPIEPGPEFERKAYMVFDPDCGPDRLNFAHELGHLLGMEHDPANMEIPSSGFPSCPWSFGHRNANLAQPQFAFRTVMSYSRNTGAAGPLCSSDAACPLIDAYSNPGLSWAGSLFETGTFPGAVPIGRNVGEPPFTYPPSKANDTLARIAPIVEAFRARPDRIFANGFQ